MAGKNGFEMNWKACLMFSIFSACVCELLLGAALFEIFPNSHWGLKGFTNVFGLAAAMICLPVPLVAIARARQDFDQLSYSQESESAPAAKFKNSLSNVLAVTYIALQGLVFSMAHLIRS